MQTQKNWQGWQSLPTQWKLLITVFLIAGLVFRFANLDKVFWCDEAYTTLRISGYTEAEAVQTLTEKQLVEPADFRYYQQLNPEKGVGDTVAGLALEEPQHAPLYFALVRIWAALFGDSITTLRWFSVTLSLLALPCMAWLCWELYQSSWASWIGLILLSISPFQILYAQEARPTALWIVTVLVSSAALLRALRLKTSGSWLIYSLTLALNFYAYLFSGFVVIAHTLYVILQQRGQWTFNLRQFSIALAIGLIAFSPWLLIVLSNPSQVETVTGWVTVKDQPNLLAWLKLWAYHLSLSFVDRGNLSLPIGVRLLFVIFQIAVRLSLIYALYLLCRRTSSRIWLFVILLAFVPIAALSIPDLIWGGKRATIPRYAVPTYIGLELAMTYLVVQYLQPLLKVRWSQRFWQSMLTLVFTAGIVSSTLVTLSPTWWNKVHNGQVPNFAQQINQADRPLVISNAEFGDISALSYYLDPKVRLLVTPVCYTCALNLDQADRLDLGNIPSGYSDIFLFKPRASEAWLNQLEQQTTYRAELLPRTDPTDDEFPPWRLERVN